ncbi:anti-sigma factor family protein [Spirillospora sp. CA-255316]
MSCLGERLTALVDGELGHEERDRAHAHLAVCERCRSEAESLRRLKGRLRELGGLPPGDGADDLPSGDFMARLRGLGQPGGGLPGGGGFPGEGVPGGGFPGGRLPGEGPGDHDDFPGRRGPDDPPSSPASPPRTRPQRGLGASPMSARPRDNRPAGRVALAPGGGYGAGAMAVRRGSPRRYLAVGAATLVIGLGAASYAAGGQPEAPTVSPAFDRFAVEHALTSGDVPMTDPVDGATPVPSVPEP